MRVNDVAFWAAKLWLLVVLLPFVGTSHAWGLKTHVWIGQQVLNDALDNGTLSIAGRTYPVPDTVLKALRAHPERYLMGHMGPDVFPDPVVGQTTTHPGIEHGWQTDQWLRHLLQSAGNSEEISFAYGFAGHASGDIFANTYVNSYAGSIFELTSQASGREVELRHFVLEKYIEALTPGASNNAGRVISLDSDLGTATSFGRDTLIMNRDAAGQYGKVSSAYHLHAMYKVRETVVNVDREIGKVVEQLTEWAAKYFKEQAKFTNELITAKHAVDVAKGQLAVEEELLNLKVQAYEFAKRQLAGARDIVKRNPELILPAERLLIEQTKVAADALASATQIAADVNNAVNRLNDEIRKIENQIANVLCPDWVPLCKEAKRLKDELDGVKKRITLQRERQQAAENIARETANARDKTKRELDNLKEEYNKAVRGVADKTYEGAIFVAEKEVEFQRAVLKKKQEALAEASKLQEKIEKELNKLNPIIDEIKKAIDNYNPIRLVLRNWIGDMDIAAEEYIKASHRAGLMMAKNSGNPVLEYKTWFDCYGQVFTAQPRQIGQAGCLAKEYLKLVQGEFDKAIDGLPEIVRWIVAPTREVSKRAMKELKPQLEKAAFQIGAFVAGPTTAEFLSLLANPENASRSKLISVYQSDNSKFRLIRYDDVATLVDRDLSLKGGILDPVKFAPLAYSVTLAKLSLLGPEQLNQLVLDMAGDYKSPMFGSPLYATGRPNFSLLLDAVRSIDGNHQWQAYGLPWPRRAGVKHATPHSSHYGHNFYSDKKKGLRIWVDPFLREKVFLQLFPTAVIGSLGERAELKWPAYNFPACPANPFPSTQSSTGAVLTEDRTCVDVKAPDKPATERPFASLEQYRSRYYHCPSDTDRHSVIVASTLTGQRARYLAQRYAMQFPDMQFEAKSPASGSDYWAVFVARCLSSELADEAREVAISRSIARDAYVVSSR